VRTGQRVATAVAFRPKTSARQELKLLNSSEPAIDVGSGELSHILFSLKVGRKTTLAVKLDFMSVFEVDIAAPCPCIGVRIFLHYADKGLVAVRILYSVPLSVFHISFHTQTVVVVERYSNRIPKLSSRMDIAGCEGKSFDR